MRIYMLHARAEAICTYRWLPKGHSQLRPAWLQGHSAGDQTGQKYSQLEGPGEVVAPNEEEEYVEYRQLTDLREPYM